MTDTPTTCEKCGADITPGDEVWFDLIKINDDAPYHLHDYNPAFHRACDPGDDNPMYVRRHRPPDWLTSG